MDSMRTMIMFPIIVGSWLRLKITTPAPQLFLIYALREGRAW